MADPILTHDEDDFSVEIIVGTDDPATVDDVDVVIHLPGRGRYSATVLTLDAIRRVMDHHAQTGESLGGRHLLVPDLLIIRTPGVPEIIDVVRDLVRDDNVDGVLPRLRDAED